MWATLIGVNIPAICGRVLAPWAFLAERIIFFPTIWLTRPLDAWLDMKHASKAITIGSVIETIVLATLYSSIVYLLLRRHLIESTKRFVRNFRWPLVAIVAIMIGSSIWLRAQLNDADYGVPLTHESPTTALNIHRPIVSEQKIAMVAMRTIPVAQLENVSIVAREGALPALIGVKTDYVHDSVYVFQRLRSDHFEAPAELPIPGGSIPLGELRCAYGSASEVRVVLPGSQGGQFRSMSLVTPDLVLEPAFLDSAEIVDGYAAGYHFKDLQITQGAEVLTTLPDFSDHNLNNAALTRTPDGLLHVLATAVLMSHDNSSRVHYLRFDPKSKKLLSNDVLMVRPQFTSTSTPRIARSGKDIDAYWHTDGGARPLPEDGIYAHRIGTHDAWHLIAETSEFAVLQDADSDGGTLVGAATRANESGVVRWFYRRHDQWYDIGQTDANEKLYTMVNTGTEPFALWRGDGVVHAAFYGLSNVVVEDLQIPPVGK